MNDFSSETNFEDIPFEKWFSKYPEHIIDNNINNVSSIIDNSTVDTDINISNQKDYDKWINGSTWPEHSSSYNKFTERLKNEEWNASIGINYETTTKFTPDIVPLVGPIWYNLLLEDDTKLSITSNLSNEAIDLSINKSSWKWNNEQTINGNFNSSKTKWYKWNNENKENFYIWSYYRSSQLKKLISNLKSQTSGSSKYDMAGDPDFHKKISIIFNGEDSLGEDSFSIPAQSFYGNSFNKNGTNFYDTFIHKVNKDNTFSINNKSYDYSLMNVKIFAWTKMAGPDYSALHLEGYHHNDDDYYNLLEIRNNHVDGEEQTMDFYVFNVNKNILFVVKHEQDASWPTQIEHLKCNNDKLYGSFYTAQLIKTDDIKNIKSYTINSSLCFSNSCNYKGNNLFKGGITNNLQNEFNQEVNCTNLQGKSVVFEPKIISPYSNTINLTMPSSTNFSKLDDLQTTIDNRNIQSTAQYASWKEDMILNSGNYSPSTNIYRIKPEISSPGNDTQYVLKLLNGEYDKNAKDLQFQVRQASFDSSLYRNTIHVTIGTCNYDEQL